MKEHSYDKSEQLGSTETGRPWNWMLFPFSSIIAAGESLYAASSGHGIYEISGSGQWEKLSAGMPEQANTNRLQMHSGLLQACTNYGLFQFDNGKWSDTGLAVPCYQYRLLGGTGYAATEYGLWIHTQDKWEQSSCTDRRVYDFLNLPQYLIVGHDQGISLYDRFMDSWAQFELNRAVTSLSVFRGHLLGSSDKGELLVGDKKGQFDRIRFGNHFIFGIKNFNKEIYVCTDHGLFRLGYIKERLMLLSVKLGFPVTDVDLQGGQFYMATLFNGIQTLDVQPQL
ncbi:hypothetical protein [Paenibacillus radicis (ex Gao et al. 2016)]|uniref:Uncharacterized protein n=1 Tax=Paenibacillus radicis (ex Gao et al. 2016) TaxID=1737354 RepID=A0A917H350_9BACL|nr:hypothetical protein [Paenibacillus radicis (ex Gao et al. 2016)]GGG66036.1 hypothetical protein GCM10010918_20490 [Paenibacillus radicis (ex Gao et al. 2016)]